MAASGFFLAVYATVM